jgi:hypothetical protein
VVRLFEAIEGPKRTHLVMEVCSGGNLCTYVKRRRRLDEGKYLHSRTHMQYTDLHVHTRLGLYDVHIVHSPRRRRCAAAATYAPTLNAGAGLTMAGAHGVRIMGRSARGHPRFNQHGPCVHH